MAEPFDIVNRPKHYNSHPSGVECVTIAKPFGYLLGNAVKYIWRCGLKESGKEIQDLEKARWYINARIEELKAEQKRAAEQPNRDALARLEEQLNEASPHSKSPLDDLVKVSKEEVDALMKDFMGDIQTPGTKVVTSLDVEQAREETVMITRDMDGALARVTKVTTVRKADSELLPQPESTTLDNFGTPPAR